MSNVFKTTVLGVGPWCIEFSDGEIVPCRTEDRAKLIAAAPELLEALNELLSAGLTQMPTYEAGKEAQDAWADRRAAARNKAAELISRLS